MSKMTDRINALILTDSKCRFVHSLRADRSFSFLVAMGLKDFTKFHTSQKEEVRAAADSTNYVVTALRFAATAYMDSQITGVFVPLPESAASHIRTLIGKEPFFSTELRKHPKHASFNWNFQSIQSFYRSCGSDLKNTVFTQCSRCKKDEGEGGVVLLSCSRCKFALYCGGECQKLDWRDHRQFCQSVSPQIPKKSNTMPLIDVKSDQDDAV